MICVRRDETVVQYVSLEIWDRNNGSCWCVTLETVRKLYRCMFSFVKSCWRQKWLSLWMDGWDDIEYFNYLRNLGDGVETSKSSYRTVCFCRWCVPYKYRTVVKGWYVPVCFFGVGKKKFKSVKKLISRMYSARSVRQFSWCAINVQIFEFPVKKISWKENHNKIRGNPRSVRISWKESDSKNRGNPRSVRILVVQYVLIGSLRKGNLR